MAHRVGLADAFATAPDDHAQLGLIVNGGGHGVGNFNGVTGGDDRLRHLAENDGHRRDIAASLGAAVKTAAGEFFRMRVVVFAHAENIATRSRQGRGQTNIFQGNRLQQCREPGPGTQALHDRQGAQHTLCEGQVHQRHRLQVIGHQADLGMLLVNKSCESHGGHRSGRFGIEAALSQC